MYLMQYSKNITFLKRKNTVDNLKIKILLVLVNMFLERDLFHIKKLIIICLKYYVYSIYYNMKLN